ncbi:MAG: ABC transporter permease [Saprospiraceae bacterium]|nr:ABC transporter permease [Saprospiraceae bacterium]MBK7788327.1 ABC transporter permease [Saprospiraceae bacterium]MBK8851543.1 ABC transporter permease [Saprospiraceae bacterium]MBK9688269.1 ABC transporter permease [Saprospiraceae bacterium]MBL0084793.1 ABC transporter permease [Saprospiraceae bacterium]
MNKTLLIIKREYVSRVLKKSFLLVTLLTPLGIGLVIFLAGLFAAKGSQSTKRIVVKDESAMLSPKALEGKEITYELSNELLDSLKKNYVDKGYDILVHVPPYVDDTVATHQISYFSKEKLSLLQIEKIEEKMENVFRDYKLEHSTLDKVALKKLDVNVKLENAMLSENNKDAVGDKSSKFSSAIASGLSYGMGFLMYIVIFVFGSMVMRSVMEEKINRIVEVMISSVKPFQLMLGKIIGVGLVGLTQLAIWMIIIPIIVTVASVAMGGPTTSPEMAQTTEAIQKIQQENPEVMQVFLKELSSINWALILPVFVIFFLGGYFIYSSLFAAVGSAVGDDLGDSQQLMMPLTIPVILAMVMIPAVFTNPNGPLAVFGSMFPLFSPIIMPARLPFEPPIWQIALSIFFLVAGVIFFTWVAARIYRVGILMYGKKVTFKELGKWMFYKD